MQRRLHKLAFVQKPLEVQASAHGTMALQVPGVQHAILCVAAHADALQAHSYEVKTVQVQVVSSQIRWVFWTEEARAVTLEQPTGLEASVPVEPSPADAHAHTYTRAHTYTYTRA